MSLHIYMHTYLLPTCPTYHTGKRSLHHYTIISDRSGVMMGVGELAVPLFLFKSLLAYD